MLKPFLRTIEALFVLAFLLQAVRVIFSVLFGIIYDQIFEGPPGFWLYASTLLVAAAMLAPAILSTMTGPEPPRRGWLTTWAYLATLGRIVITINNPQVRFWGSLVVIAAGGLYLAGLIILARAEVFAGLVGALAFDQVLRAAGYTYDLSLRPGWLPVQIALAVGLLALSGWLRRTDRENAQPPAGFGRAGGLALGGWLFIEMTLLALPNGIARWTNGPYAIITPALLAVTILPMIPAIYQAVWTARLANWWRFALALVLAGGLMAGYFASGPLAWLALLCAHLAALALLLYIFDNAPPEHRPAGRNIALGMLLFLALSFASAFTFTYPYTIPALRGLGWAVYAAAALFAGLGAVLIAAPAGELESPPIRSLPVILIGLGALAVSLAVVWPRPAPPASVGDTIRVGTYNIHYGYDDVWRLTLEDIALTIEESGADVVALQEVDAGRLTSYAVDNAYYLARRLDMDVIYLPTVEHLTGIALLYRPAALAVDTQLISSLQEQTGIVHVQLDTGEVPLHAYGIWMGLSDEDTQRQIDEALAFIGSRSPAVFGGDFNATYDEPVGQAVQAAGFVDPFTALGMVPAPPTSPAPNPEHQIDFVWVRGVEALSARVLPSEASDHYMVIVEIALK
jgi:endonuclease/exonuclease/phosphatase family metal-dependent hydrolase